MANELAFVAIAQVFLVAQLVDLAQVVQERAHQEQVAVDLRIAGADAEHDLHEIDDVFQKAAQVGVMVLHSGRAQANLAIRA